MDYYKAEEKRNDKSKKPLRGEKRVHVVRTVLILVLILIAGGALALFLKSDRLSTLRIKDVIISALPGQKPIFYHLEIEKNGKEYFLKTTDVFDITYRDEFVIKDVSTSSLFGRGVSVDMEELGIPKAMKVLLKGVDLVDRVMQGEGRGLEPAGEYRIRVTYSGEVIAAIPVKVVVTPQDWLRVAKEAKSGKSQIESLKQAGELTKSDPQVNRMLAKAYIQEGMHEKAVREYQKVLRRKPDDVIALAELAKIYLDRKKYNDAVAQYKKIVKIKPGDAAAYANMAFAYGGLGNWEAAKAAYLESLKRAPDNVTVRYHLAETYEKTGQSVQAAEQFRIALRGKPGDRAIMTALAASYLKARKYDEAIRIYNELIRKSTKDASLYANLGLAYGGKGKINEEISSYKKALALNPRNATVHFNLAMAYEKKGMAKDAAKEYEKTLKLKPDDADALAKIGESFVREKKYSQAIKLYERAVKKSPKNPGLLANYAYALGEMKKYGEAATYYEKALRQGARDPQIHYNLAYTYDKLGEKRKAIAEYEKYAATHPTMDILSKLADHYMKANNYSGAVKSYERMIKIQPKKASLYAGLGYAHGLKGNIDKEIDNYRTALRYDRDNEDVHLKLGAAYEKKEMWNEALAEYSKAYQLNPDSSRTARKIPQLKIKIIRQKHKET